MGDGAWLALREFILDGMPGAFPQGPVPRRPKTHPCKHCERVLRGPDALAEHMKAKHPNQFRKEEQKP